AVPHVRVGRVPPPSHVRVGQVPPSRNPGTRRVGPAEREARRGGPAYVLGAADRVFAIPGAFISCTIGGDKWCFVRCTLSSSNAVSGVSARVRRSTSFSAIAPHSTSGFMFRIGSQYSLP